MRWVANGHAIPGARRRIKRFALFPTRVSDRWVWLEFYWQIQYFGILIPEWFDQGKELIER